jgi:hypothetical protein
MKHCHKCDKIKPLTQFGKSKVKKDGHKDACKVCSNAENTARRTANPDNHRIKNLAYARSAHGKAMHRAGQLRRKYWPEMTNEQAVAEYDRLLALQNNCCGLCGIHQSAFKVALAVDHQKHPHKVRGLLCNKCNRFEVGRHTLESAEKMVEYFKLYEIIKK